MIASLISRSRTQFYQSAWFPVVFLLFIAEFYFIPESKWQSNLFRVGLLLPFLLVFPWQQIKSRLASSPTLLVACLLIFSLLLSLTWSTAAEPDATEKTLYHGLYIAGFVLIGSDILLRNPGYDERFFYWLGWVIVITGILSIWWFYQDHHFPKARLKSIGQLRHPGFGAIMYGFVGLYHFMGIPYAAGTNAWRRWLPGVLAAAMGLVVIILAQSRGVFLALFLMLLLGSIITRQRRYPLLLALIVLSIAVTVVWWPDELLTMVSRRGWDSHRLEIWQQALALFRQSPLLGHGLLENAAISVNGKSFDHPHNILLSTVLYGGMLAGGLLLLLIGLVLRQGWQHWSADRDPKPLLLTVFGCTYLMTDGYRLISNPVPNWVYFWLPVIWAISRELREQLHGNHTDQHNREPMRKPTSCTLIISIYNQATQLRRVLETVATQSITDFDIIIADDGSVDNAEAVINDFSNDHPGFKLTHLWHEDSGFCKTIILNKAFKAARGDYIIVIDGDMLLHPRFIENHLRYARKDRVLCGFRGVKLGREITRALLDGEQPLSQNPLRLIWQTLSGKVKEGSRGIVIHNRWLRRLIARRSKRLAGCNFSTYRENLFAVNGMDETILTYGFEDFELGHRLTLSGVQISDVSRLCNTCHLHHPKRSSGDIRDIKQRILNSTAVQCRYGLQILASGSSIEDFMPPDRSMQPSAS